MSFLNFNLHSYRMQHVAQHFWQERILPSATRVWRISTVVGGAPKPVGTLASASRIWIPACTFYSQLWSASTESSDDGHIKLVAPLTFDALYK
eukprot:4770255-Pyramimonas_sp.AAC.1